MKPKHIFRKSLLVVLSVLLTLCLSTCTDSMADNAVAYHDSIPDAAMRRATYWYMANPRQTISVLDSVERIGKIPKSEILTLKAMAYQFGLGDNLRSLKFAKHAYDIATANNDTIGMLNSMKVLTAISYEGSHYTDIIMYANHALDLAKSTGNMESEAFFLMALGCAKSEIDNVDDAIAYLTKSIKLYGQLPENARSWAANDNMLFAMVKKVEVLVACHRADEAMELLPICESILGRMKSSETIVYGLADVRQAELLAAKVNTYYAVGMADKARECYGKIKKTDYWHTEQGVDIVVPYLVASVQYHDALRCIAIKKKYMQDHGLAVTYYYIKTLLRNEFLCYYRLGMHKEAALSANANMLFADSLRTREKKDYVASVKKVFADRELEVQLAEHERKARDFRLVIAVSSVLLIALVVILVIVVRYNRVLKAKDRANISTMEDLRRLNKLLVRKNTDVLMPEVEEYDDSDRKNFVVVCNEIISRKLFLQHGFCREDALTIVPMGAKEFSAMFQKYSTGFTSFINNLRLDYSLEILRTHNDFTVEGIALESGFANRQTYHRLFVDKYGMTPVEYKKFLNGKKTL